MVVLWFSAVDLLHVAPLTHFMSALNYELSALLETWLIDESAEVYNMSQDNSVHLRRKDKLGAGVSIFVQNDFQFILRKDLTFNSDEIDVESVFLEIAFYHFGGNNIIIWGIYRPPDSNINSFNDVFAAALDVINDERKLCVKTILLQLIF